MELTASLLTEVRKGRICGVEQGAGMVCAGKNPVFKNKRSQE